MLAGQRHPSAQDCERLARPNPRTEFTLVVADPDAPGSAVIAAVAAVQSDPAAHEGFFTILVSRFVSGLGMRRYLLTRIAKWARSRGVGILRGDLPQDPSVLQLAESLGFRRVDGAEDPSLVRVALEPARR